MDVGNGEGMTRRCLTITTTFGLWCVGGLLLSGSAAFLFSAMLHRFGTDGWFMSTFCALGLGGAGSLAVGIGWWLTHRARGPAQDEAFISDDAMWLA